MECEMGKVSELPDDADELSATTMMAVNAVTSCRRRPVAFHDHAARLAALARS